jgi:hypothetical protein
MTRAVDLVGMTTTTIAPETTEPAAAPLSWPARITLASLAAGAAVIHLAMVPAHAAEWLPLGIGFAAAGWVQLVFAVGVVARPSRRWLQLGLVVNVLFVIAWAVSRTSGFPVGPMAGEVEAVSLIDGLCVGLEAVTLLAVTTMLVRPRTGSRLSIPAFLGGAALPALAVVAMTTAALASPAGSHGHDHDRSAPGGDHAAMDATDHLDHDTTDHMDHDVDGAMDHGHDDHDATATGAETEGESATASTDDHAHVDGEGLSSGVPAGEHDHADAVDAQGVTHMGSDHEHADCSAPVTAEQQGAADDLIRETLHASAKYQDFNQAVADGYVPITPPGSPLVHYGNLSYMSDGHLLDPDHIETIMYAFDKNRTPYFVGTMYLNDDASVTPPSPGGCLMQWHDHTNLCIAEGKGMVGVVKPDGTCPAGSSNEVTTQMIHVWTIPLPSGPLSHDPTPEQVKAGVIQMKTGAA